MNPELQEWEVRNLDKLDTSDLQLVSDFLNDQFPGVFYPKCTPEMFQWKLGPSNPAGRGFISAAICQGQVIGIVSLTRKNMIKNGVPIAVVEVGDVYTHPQFRRGGKCISPVEHLDLDDIYYEKSIFGRLVAETLFRAKLSGVKFVYGTPNAMARPSYLKRLNFLECGGERIYSKYLLTKHFKPSPVLSPLIRILSCTNQTYSRFLVKIHFGKNAIVEVQGEEVLVGSNLNQSSVSSEPDQLEMFIDNQYVLNRYIEHPSLKYSFYRVSSRRGTLGYVIATEIVRASGIRTFVISDWITLKPEFAKKFNLIIGSLRAFSRKAQTISLWQIGTIPRYNLFLSGIFSTKSVSIVGKSLDDQTPTSDFIFSDFRFGWSDNG